ncbi:MAG: Holliday junction branch migration protein RuvA [Candidatus Marinimicrobia bacterium]|jgi:Holliday junction DNA helicase RuvA|nr:Holliday junction branch migration protein RuvA [Candidatus Neomarinimicrobiota bacterium]MBP9004960.1 Holliday junction branch migration protein RuvA [Candidatus Neomarinimicrobiota bacterium]HNZ36780.1 Holliday junction branch migration protein RuvA [Candidatus Neomarinimicrobiota bacterium]HOD37308.1 Holliday junction branch migration protein RuvA [Candidatus Neomarinimicrobiota bacterium]HOG75542.1 Holliday junction branch migration protein RuvA [Candidatus Neomarinimicrobiota bacterium]
MFAYISGKLFQKEPTSVIIDVNGIGYQINIPLSTYSALPATGQNAKLLTYYHVREDIQALYGFATPEEKELFLLLISVSGIGPKMAMTILSGTSPEQFRRRILDGDVESLTLIPGIGLKTARRIIVELGEKIGQTSEVVSGELATVTLGATGEEALRALISLGYRRAEALNALRKAVKELGDSAPVEKYIKAALNQM